MFALILKFLKSKYKNSLLQTIQFLIGFLAIIMVTGCMQYVNEYRDKVKAIVPSDIVHIFFDEPEECDGNEEKSLETKKSELERLDKLWDELKNEPYVKDTGMFELRDIFKDNDNYRTKLYMLDDFCLNMTDWSFAEGDISNLLNYDSKKVIPVIVSDSLSTKYMMGEEYVVNSYKMKEKQTGLENVSLRLKIVGVLKPSMTYLGGNSSQVTSGIINNTDFIIAPKYDAYESEFTFCYNGFVKTNDDEVSKVEEFFLTKEMNVQLSTAESEIELYC